MWVIMYATLTILTGSTPLKTASIIIKVEGYWKEAFDVVCNSTLPLGRTGKMLEDLNGEIGNFICALILVAAPGGHCSNIKLTMFHTSWHKSIHVVSVQSYPLCEGGILMVWYAHFWAVFEFWKKHYRKLSKWEAYLKIFLLQIVFSCEYIYIEFITIECQNLQLYWAKFYRSSFPTLKPTFPVLIFTPISLRFSDGVHVILYVREMYKEYVIMFPHYLSL